MRVLKAALLETARMLVLLAGVTLIAFLMITHAPIDPLTSYIGPDSTLSQEAREEIEDYWGLNESLPRRFLTWADHALHGDLGRSITYKRPVLDVIGERMVYSFVLMLLAWTLSGLAGFGLGILCGLHPDSLFDRTVRAFCLTTRSSPTFWLGLLMLTLFAVQLGWFPIGMAVPPGKLASEVTLLDRLHHLALPVLTLTITGMSEVVLYTRRKLTEIMETDFILYARARGENRNQLVRRHVLRNIALPAVTVQFASFSELFGGMALAENIFSYPGVGSATTAAAMNGDVPLLLGLVVFSALFVFAGNLAADLMYGLFDPRIREGGSYV